MKEKWDQSGIFVEKKIVIPIAQPGNHDQQHTEQKNVECKQNMQERFHSDCV